MLTALKYFYRPTNQTRVIPLWKQFVQSGKPQQAVLKKRFLSTDLITSQEGNKLLQFVLREADIPFLAKFDDDFYIYTTQVIPLIHQFKNIFDLARSGRAYRGLFIHAHQTQPWEYIIPTDDNDWLKFFPMGESFPMWDKIRPLTLWDHDSTEYTLDMMSNGLKFHTADPSYVLWLFDLPALIMKAIKFHQWRKEFTTLPGFENQYARVNFVQHHVFDAFQSDNVHQWQFKLHRLAVDILLGNDTKAKINELSVRSQTQYGSVGPRFKETMHELLNFYTNVQNGSLLPITVMNINFFHDCTKSLASIAQEIPVKYDIPHLSQYRYLRFLRDLPYLEYLIRVYTLNKQSAQYSNLMARLNNLTTKWLNEIPFTSIKNINHRTLVRSKLEWLNTISWEEIQKQ